MTTALAILTSDGYVNTLLGTIFPLIPAFLPYLALALLYLNRVIASCLALIATIFISPARADAASARSFVSHDWQVIIDGSVFRHVILIIIAIPPACLLLGMLVGFGPTVVIRTIGAIAIMVLLPVIVHLYPAPLSRGFYVDILSQPWLPSESITLATHKTVIGYQLQSDGYWLEILTDDGRSIEYYQTSQVSARSICQMASISAMRPLVLLAKGAPAPKPCSYFALDSLERLAR
jgi:hypothetical protein